MDVLVELLVSTVVALAAAVFAHFGVPLGGDGADDGRAVRRSPVAVSAPAADARVTRVTAEEDCPELKLQRAVVHAETIGAESLHEAIETVVAQADEDAAEAAAMAAEMLAEREAERLDLAAERAEALAERRAEDAAA